MILAAACALHQPLVLECVQVIEMAQQAQVVAAKHAADLTQLDTFVAVAVEDDGQEDSLDGRESQLAANEVGELLGAGEQAGCQL